MNGVDAPARFEGYAAVAPHDGSSTGMMYVGPSSTEAGSVKPAVEDLQCPDCGTALEDVTGCASCGLRFPTLNGRPQVFASRPREVVQTWKPDEIGEVPASVLRFPPRTGQDPSGVVRLDRAHAEVLSALPRGSRLLDIGCGGGQMRGWAVDRGLSYVGIDVAGVGVPAWLRTHGGPDLYADAHALPFADNSFDAVSAISVWQYLALAPLAMAEVSRVLRPGGVMVGTVNFLSPWHDGSRAHLTPLAIDRMLRQAGLEPRLIWPGPGWPVFRSVMVMGNKATRVVSGVGWLAYGWYLAPKAIQLSLMERRLPSWDELHPSISRIAGGFAWIADTPPTSDDTVSTRREAEQ